MCDKSTPQNRVTNVLAEKSAVADTTPESRMSGKQALEPNQSIYYVHPKCKFPDESKAQWADAVASDARAWDFEGDEAFHFSGLLSA